ncbi:MAG: hypothetical protein EB150_01815 [Nitrososphaeria archaeon]|nr:hypothetical protein [Nitrososphaeria archaeon]NDB50747.1 hypothetical protein [Nitrosopumilaceae archaeon]NDB88262.1 hypothetical protein [Nitrososphaerota archaeon]NDB46117.1 hypothetical protein [Nitrososphaeria archaeon]NDB89903.1 hypothetical protein [Nitrososphaerota archaeon]
MTYSIWLVPKYADAKHLGIIIQKLARQYAAPGFSAHITLFSGIKNLNEAKSAVRLVCSRPIKAKVVGIGTSGNIWKTLFFQIKKDSTIAKIYKTLDDSLSNRYSFCPHVSLVYKNLDKDEKAKIKSGIKAKPFYTFDRLVIIRSSKNVKKWQKLYSLRLDATRRA